MYLCIVLLLFCSNVCLLIARKAEHRKEKKRKEIADLTVKILDKQIEILSQGDWAHISMELEISKYIKDGVLIDLVEGRYSSGDILKAHKWLRDAFM